MIEHKSCKELLEGLSAYIDNEASEAICQEIERHLNACDNCRIMLDTLWKTISLSQVVDSTDQMPRGLQERLLETLAIEDSRSGETSDPPIDP